jgi:hypothetical protein
MSQLIETSEGWSEATANAESRLIENISLLGSASKNGYRYAESAMRGAVGLYEGVHVYLDHAKKGEPRKTRDLAGVVESPRFEEAGADGVVRIRGNVRALRNEAGNTLLSLAEAKAKKVGMSHVAEGTKSKDGKVVERIDAVASVDAVLNPATTSSFSEQESVMDLKSLREAHPDLVRQIEESAATAALELAEEAKNADDAKVARLKATHNAEMAEAVKAAKADAIKEEAKRQADIRSLCETAKLPDFADTLCQEQTCDIEEARRRLFDELVKRHPAPAAGGGKKGLEEKADEDAEYRKEFAEGNLGVVLNLTESQYINSRRKDDGKPPLAESK